MHSSSYASKSYITVVTATYNAAKCIRSLADSLRAQSNCQFKWIVVDGKSTDETLDILSDYSDVTTLVISEADFGIYDALNKGIRACSTPYYLVAGADDVLDPECIQNYTSILMKSGADLISAVVVTTSGDTLYPARGNRLRYGHQAYVSQHAIGTLIKTSLHQQVGYYSRKFPIAADRHFLLKVIDSDHTLIEKADFISGTFSIEGVSGSQVYDALLDIAKVDFELSRHKKITAFVSIIRIFLNVIRL